MPREEPAPDCGPEHESFSHFALHLAKYALEAVTIAEMLDHAQENPGKARDGRAHLEHFLKDRPGDISRIARLLESAGWRELETPEPAECACIAPRVGTDAGTCQDCGRALPEEPAQVEVAPS